MCRTLTLLVFCNYLQHLVQMTRPIVDTPAQCNSSVALFFRSCMCTSVLIFIELCSVVCFFPIHLYCVRCIVITLNKIIIIKKLDGLNVNYHDPVCQHFKDNLYIRIRHFFLINIHVIKLGDICFRNFVFRLRSMKRVFSLTAILFYKLSI